MTKQNIPLYVCGIAAGLGDEPPLVILQDKQASLSVRIPVGPSEASAIILQLEGIAPLRPLTHDLLASFFLDHGFRMECAEIYNSHPERTAEYFLARIRYHKGPRKWEKDVRPSDAIALALRLGAPILAPRELLVNRTAWDSSGASKTGRLLFLQAAQVPGSQG